MDENFEHDQITELEPKKTPGFGKGILVGILSTLAAVIVIGGAVIGISGAFGKSKDKDQNQNQQIQTGQEDKTDDNNGSGIQIAGDQVLNSDLLTQISMLNTYLKEYYLHDVDVEELRTGMLQGMIAALGDPYSQYFDEEELASFNDSTQGEYVGIGAAVTQELKTGIVRISRPYEGTPSAEAGLLPGDVLVSVDGTEVTGMDLNRVVSLIKGEEGTTVTLHIYREDKEEYSDIVVTRKKVELPTVSSKMLEDKIGYIEVTGFEGVTANQFIAAFEALKDQGMERVIVDLRNNGGGLVDTVTSMLDYLLPEGVIFYAKDKKDVKSMEYISDKQAALDIPMVVLVNGNTASAAEIFSGNIQEFGMGKVVGTTTYGKGVMQQMFYTNVDKTAAVKLTVADYYYHNDKNINGVGVIPDVEVELDEEASKLLAIPIDKDNQLQKAIETVKAQ